MSRITWIVMGDIPAFFALMGLLMWASRGGDKRIAFTIVILILAILALQFRP
jgi:hypothetical protein